jgi:hypothetical protein
MRKGIKFGCIVLVKLPAMLRFCCQELRKDVHTTSDNGVSSDGVLVLFIN